MTNEENTNKNINPNSKTIDAEESGGFMNFEYNQEGEDSQPNPEDDSLDEPINKDDQPSEDEGKIINKDGSVEDDTSDDGFNENEYNDYSDFALVAMSEVEEGNFNTSKEEIPKDLDAYGLREMYRDVKQDQIENIRNQVSNQYQEQAKYLERLRQGATEDEVQRSMQIDDFLQLDESNEEHAKALIQAEMALKNMDQEEIETLTNSYFEKGNYQERAQKSKQFFEQKDKELEEQAKYRMQQRQQQQQQQAQQVKETVDNFLESDKIGGIPVSSEDRNQLEKAINNPTEIVEMNRGGEKIRQKVSKGMKWLHDLNNDIETQIKFIYFMMKDGDFSEIEESSKKKRDNQLLNMANSRTIKNNNNNNNSRNGFRELEFDNN